MESPRTIRESSLTTKEPCPRHAWPSTEGSKGGAPMAQKKGEAKGGQDKGRQTNRESEKMTEVRRKVKKREVA